jgi:addiction module HigA family antidote
MYYPPHQGDFLKEEVIESLVLTVTDAAKILGVARPALSNLLNGKASLSPEMALRFEKAFGLKMDTLLRMQTSYDIAKIRKTANEIKIKRYEA